MQHSHHLMLSLLLSSKKPLLHPALHLNTEHDITGYRISHLIGCLGQPNHLLVKINSIPAEPMTMPPLNCDEGHTDWCNRRLFTSLKILWCLRLPQGLVYEEVDLFTQRRWANDTKQEGLILESVHHSCDRLCFIHFLLLYYYITIYIIPFPSKLSSLLINGFDSVGRHYLKQGIQLSFVDSVCPFH